MYGRLFLRSGSDSQGGRLGMEGGPIPMANTRWTSLFRWNMGKNKRSSKHNIILAITCLFGHGVGRMDEARTGRTGGDVGRMLGTYLSKGSASPHYFNNVAMDIH